MSFTAVPCTIRMGAITSIRSFSTTSSSNASILFSLAALSNSRETQHYNKLSRLPRVEHSPPLKLIKQSEVDPYPCPTLPKPIPRLPIQPAFNARTALRIWDQRALQVGRMYLANQARQTHRLMRSLARAKRREARQNLMQKRDRQAWNEERRKLHNDMRAAGIWILLSVGAATVLATWRFWPDKNVPDSGQLGRKIAARAAAAMPLPAAVSVEPTLTAPVVVPVPPASQATAAKVGKPKKVKKAARPLPPPVEPTPSQSWWKGMFWKQQ